MPDENAANGKNRLFRGNVRIWYVQNPLSGSIEFECAEGKKIIYRMDREKEDIGWDGNLAVAVYVEGSRTDFVWNRQECCHSSLKETGEMRIRDEIILTPGSHL